MPSSRPNTIPAILDLVRQLRPRSVLDVGVGFGKWGHLFREYTDILAAEHDPKRYQRRHWRVRIDGIEGHAAYLTPMHRYLYSHLYCGDLRRVLPRLGSYDLIFLGDVIEHLTKEDGRRLLDRALEKARKAVVVSTPKFETEQPALCGNELERHRSLWSARDFKSFPGAHVRTLDGSILLAVMVRPGVPPLQWGRGSTRRAGAVQETHAAMQQTIRALCETIPVEVPFILVDEEQVRTELPHRRIIPFLEKDGRFWGPPADDAAAVAAVKGLRRRGARGLALIWSTFWWLDRYPALADYLRGHGRCVRDDDLVKFYAWDRRKVGRPPDA